MVHDVLRRGEHAEAILIQTDVNRIVVALRGCFWPKTSCCARGGFDQRSGHGSGAWRGVCRGGPVPDVSPGGIPGVQQDPPRGHQTGATGFSNRL